MRGNPLLHLARSMNNSTHHFNFKASIALVIAILCWSTVPLFLRSFIDEFDGWVSNGVRYPFAALLWSIPLIILIRKGHIRPIYFKQAILPAFVNVMAQVLFAWAPYFLEPGIMMFLSRLSMIFALLGSFILFPDELALARSKTFWFGLFLCVVGFIGINAARGNLSAEGNWKGVLIMVACTCFYGFYGVTVRYSMRGIKPWISFPIICIYTSFCLLIFMFLFGEPARLLDMTVSRLGVVAISAIIGIACAHVFFYYAIEHLGVSICNGCQFVIPFITSTASYFIFEEIFTVPQIVYGVILIGGAGLLLKAQKYLKIKQSPAPTGQIPEIEEVAAVDEVKK